MLFLTTLKSFSIACYLISLPSACRLALLVSCLSDRLSRPRSVPPGLRFLRLLVLLDSDSPELGDSIQPYRKENKRDSLIGFKLHMVTLGFGK